MINDPDHGNNVDNEQEGCRLSLNFNAPVVLVGGGLVGDAAFELSKMHANFFVGVDGGGDEILRRGAVPEAVIGDLDSFSDAGRAAIPPAKLIHVAEQDSTDFEKALSRLAAPLILAIGFTGARLDHELAAMHVLVRYPRQPVLLIGQEDVVVHLPARIALDVPPGTRVSLFPMDGVTVGLHGVEWAFDALDLHPARKIGTSNRAGDGPVVLKSDRPGCLLLLPVEMLEQVIAALAAADFHSPHA